MSENKFSYTVRRLGAGDIENAFFFVKDETGKVMTQIASVRASEGVNIIALADCIHHGLTELDAAIFPAPDTPPAAVTLGGTPADFDAAATAEKD